MTSSEHVHYAGFGRRAVAGVLDGLLLTLIGSIVHRIVLGDTGFNILIGPSGLEFQTDYDWFDDLVIVAITLFMWIKFLGTPGKLLMGCHVVDEKTLGPVSFRQAAIRYLGYFVSALPLFAGFIWVAFDKKKQGFHDKLAKTIVVVESDLQSDDESTKSLEQILKEVR